MGEVQADPGDLSQKSFESWDPLEQDRITDEGIFISAQRREINNILKSYTGYYDLFAEMIQNAIDAVERRSSDDGTDGYKAQIWITVDIPGGLVAVTDNGCGMTPVQFRQFLKPNFSFKEGSQSRGCKGVGATYLAYGFNHLEVATKLHGQVLSSTIQHGREWVEDRFGVVTRPRVETSTPTHPPFHNIDRGTSMTIKVVGPGVRPKNLGWIGATSADQWLSILSTATPVGGIYLAGC